MRRKLVREINERDRNRKKIKGKKRKREWNIERREYYRWRKKENEKKWDYWIDKEEKKDINKKWKHKWKRKKYGK